MNKILTLFLSATFITACIPCEHNETNNCVSCNEAATKYMVMNEQNACSEVSYELLQDLKKTVCMPEHECMTSCQDNLCLSTDRFVASGCRECIINYNEDLATKFQICLDDN